MLFSVLLSLVSTTTALALDSHVQRYTILINGNPSIPPASNIQRYNIEIKAPVYLTLESGNNVNITAEPNVEKTGSVQIKVVTTSPSGYTLSLKSSDGNTTLVCTSSSQSTIPSITTDNSSIADNSWGFKATTTNTTTPTSWNKIPGSTPVAVGSGNGSTTGDYYYLYFGVKTNYAQQPCTSYNRQLTLTGEAQ
ncbi:MAG: hypothetical protein LBE03_01905 [Candidatus Nomurabacteria bacterium]|nr:hypothetical protein [Candidatus Nomurabacteria bacterium]